MGHAMAQLVEALRYKPEGREFDMEAKDIHKEMLPIWAAFLCG
jgi:hypothetical protein